MSKYETRIIKDQVLKITTDTKPKVINFLGVTFDLINGMYNPYTKELYNHRYVERQPP